jgi:ABC-type proline/glycine betaine transport system permease subunit
MRALAVLITFAAAFGLAHVVNNQNGDELLAAVLSHIWIMWTAVFLVALISVSVMVTHLYPKKEY